MKPAMHFFRLTSSALLALLLAGIASARTYSPPAGLPHYDLEVSIDVDKHQVTARERVTWTNRHSKPAQELVFNFHSHYSIPAGDVVLLAKTLEILRTNPSEGLDFGGPAGEVRQVSLIRRSAIQQAGVSSIEKVEHQPLRFHYQPDNATALVVPLPEPIGPGESVTIELELTLRLPQKQGRWGQWKGVTTLVSWLPVLAVYDDACGWQPTPFVPWHQPFFNEAGIYTARVRLPAAQQIACSASVEAVRDLGDGWQEISYGARCLRDFAMVCSERFHVHTATKDNVRVRVLALPEHDFYANVCLRVAGETLAMYSRWFGPYPYEEFTLVESFFGWFGNESAGLVMIDHRQLGMPHAAEAYIESLLAHEICHQWWFNVVGTNGYAETFMDEALATHFSHQFMDQKFGKNNAFLDLPRGLRWLPNIHRDNYRYSGLYGSVRRGDLFPCVQDMPKYGHLINLSSMCYDRGSLVINMIQTRLGETSFYDFMRHIYCKYYFRILRVADFQRELEEFTGRCWEQFFQQWVHGKGMCDWCIENVKTKPQTDIACRLAAAAAGQEGDDAEAGCLAYLPLAQTLRGRRGKHKHGSYRVTVVLHQKADYDEPTYLGICLQANDNYQIRIPIMPQISAVELDDPPCRIECLPDHRIRVEIDLPCKPLQIAVDPDKVILDTDPSNNLWKRRIHWRLTPLYTMLDETDLTTEYDCWNVIAGPWLFLSASSDPWYTRSTMVGVRAGAYRTQEFTGGVYAAYRTDYRDIVAGADGMWNHAWHPKLQFGFNLEKRLVSPWDSPAPNDVNRALVFGRYVWLFHSSLYLPPMKHVEAFGVFQDNALPFARTKAFGAERPDRTYEGGVHYHVDYLTPYWDAEGGYKFDATLSGGVADLDRQQGFGRASAQLSYVKMLPEWTGPLSTTRLAARIYGAGALPLRGEFFTMGGGSLFRGFDQADRQGSVIWVSSLEWRIPLLRQLECDVCDHIAGLRTLSVAAFYDVGDAYANRRSLGPVAHAVGGGLRLDIAWFSFIERTLLRLDVAKTLSEPAPLQVWFSMSHPF